MIVLPSGMGARVLLARQFAAAVAVLLLTTAACCFVFSSVADAQAQASSGACEGAAELAVLPSPLAPWKGAPLRVIVAAEKALEGELSLVAPDGRVAAKSRERHGGPPYFLPVAGASPAAGTWRAKLTRESARGECSMLTHEIAVRAGEPPRLQPSEGTLWPLRNTWNRDTEDLHSAWFESLFAAQLGTTLSWNTRPGVRR